MSFAACIKGGAKSSGASGACPADTTKTGNAAMKDGVEVQWWSIGVQAPFDKMTGHASGKRAHQTLKIKKIQGVSDAWFYKCLVGNETIASIELDVFRSTTKVTSGGLGAKAGGSPEVLYFTAKLTNAHVVNCQTSTAVEDVDGGIGAKRDLAHDVEEITTIEMAYQKIECMFTQFSKGWDDDWVV